MSHRRAGKPTIRGNPHGPVRSQVVRRTLLVGSGASIMVLGVAGTGATAIVAGATASTSSPVTQPHAGGALQAVAAGETGDPLAEFQAELLQQFPTNFGGFYQNPDRTYSVVMVGTNPTFEQMAQQLFNEVPAKFGVSVPAATLKLTFVDGARTLASLYAVQDQVKAFITSEMQSGSALSIIGVGIDQQRGQVVISALSTPAGTSASATMAEQYGSAVRTQMMTSIPTTEAGRTDDAPPWKAGDQIMNLAETTGCTLGFGVHNTSTGQRFSLTAGHCGTNLWYNTNFTFPTKNTSNKVGSTYAGSLSIPANGGKGLDLQLIADSSSPFMWNGPIGTTTRLTISGYANPVDGATVCTEGSFTGKHCGTVSRAGGTIVVTDSGKRYTVEDTFTTEASSTGHRDCSSVDVVGT